MMTKVKSTKYAESDRERLLIQKSAKHLYPLQRLTGGVVNTLVVFHLAEDTEKKDALVFRIYSSYGGTLEQDDQGDVPGVLSRDGELMAMQVGTRSATELELMMTSSNGNIFRVTGHLCGEFTGPR